MFICCTDFTLMLLSAWGGGGGGERGEVPGNLQIQVQYCLHVGSWL